MKSIILRQHEVIHLRDTGSVIAWRVVKPGSLLSESDGAKRRVLHLPHDLEVLKGFLSQRHKDPCKRFCKFGQTGEQRFVKETGYWIQENGKPCVAYRADGEHKPPGCSWTPSTHMPFWASRFTVTLDVGVKRIQEVTEEEAIASGIKCPKWTGKPYCTNCSGHESMCHRTQLINTLADHDGDFNSYSYFWKITCTLKKP